MDYFDLYPNLRYSELLQEAERDRLGKHVKHPQSRFHVRAVQSVGDTLISLGKSLKSLSLSL